MEEFKEIKRREGYPIEDIYPNSWNVNVMDDKMFDSLVESIKKTRGKYLRYNPIKIRKIRETYYEIIDGEKRWKACKELGYSHIPAIVEDVDREEAKVMNVIYNNNRNRAIIIKLPKPKKTLLSEGQLREILWPLLAAYYHKIKISLIPGTKEISLIEIDLFRNNCYGGDLKLELVPGNVEDREWFVKRQDEKIPTSTTVDYLRSFFKNYIIQKRALHEELIKEV